MEEGQSLGIVGLYMEMAENYTACMRRLICVLVFPAGHHFRIRSRVSPTSNHRTNRGIVQSSFTTTL